MREGLRMGTGKRLDLLRAGLQGDNRFMREITELLKAIGLVFGCLEVVICDGMATSVRLRPDIRLHLRDGAWVGPADDIVLLDCGRVIPVLCDGIVPRVAPLLGGFGSLEIVVHQTAIVHIWAHSHIQSSESNGAAWNTLDPAQRPLVTRKKVPPSRPR